MSRFENKENYPIMTDGPCTHNLRMASVIYQEFNSANNYMNLGEGASGDITVVLDPWVQCCETLEQRTQLCHAPTSDLYKL